MKSIVTAIEASESRGASMWRTSIATVSLSGDLGEKLTSIARAGYDGVEIFEADFLAFDRSPAEVGRMIRDAGLKPVVFQPFRDFEGMPEPHRARAFDRAERKFDLMQAIGADLLLVCSNISPFAVGGLDRSADDLSALGDRAGRRGLKIGYEALAWGRFINDHRDAWEIVRRANHPAVGLILDSFHTLARDIPVDSIRSLPKEKIFLVQIADAPRLQLDMLHWSRHFRNFPGQGELPVAEFARAISETGYDGYWSLEVFNDQFRAGSPRTIAVDGKRSLDFLATQLKEPGHGALPARAECEAIAFVEFSVDDAEARDLEAIFLSLGFRRFATHKRKDVTVWTQGTIKFVVNREREGFAHSFYITHGPSVCAIGVCVKDAKAAIARASALHATGFRQSVVPGEVELPAIRGVGGSLIYFLESDGDLGNVWTAEFELCAPSADDSYGLLNLDHIAQTMDYDEMLSAVLFYTSIFDLDKTPALDIADPGGLVRSQVVQNRDGAVRLTLNGSQSQRTLSGRFINEFFGSGVQHIALATPDIKATADLMEKAGLRPLRIPRNYYDDLQARFGLADDRIEDLAHRNILYDRDQEGEYLQIYTPVFADRFFFEIVERRGYTGFGAPNAAIRLAAQARMFQARAPY